MYEALRAKFTQNPVLLEQLRSTGDAIITEANISNPFWTCGVSARNLNRLNDTERWHGQNTLGDMLAHLREELKDRLY